MTDKPINPSKKTTKDQTKLVNAMANTLMAINSSLNLDEVLDCILNNLKTIIPNKTSNIMLLDGKNARIMRCKGYDVLGTEEAMMAQVLDVTTVPSFTKMIVSKRPVLVYNPRYDVDWDNVPESDWIRSYISAPILSGEQVIGFINCDSDLECFYNKAQLVDLEFFAVQAGVAIKNAQLYRDLWTISEKLKLINEIVQQVLAEKTIEDILKLLPSKLEELFDARSIYISKWDEINHIAFGWACSENCKDDFSTFKSEIEEHTITEHVLQTGKAVFIPNITNTAFLDQKFARHYHEKTLLCLPLMTHTEKFGSIIAGFENVKELSNDMIALCENMAFQISTAFEKVYSNQQKLMQINDLEYANNLMETLSRVSTSINTSPDSKSVLENAGRELEKLGIHSMVSLKSGAVGALQLTYTSVSSKFIPTVEKLSSLKVSDIRTPIDNISFIRKLMYEQIPQFIDDPSEVLKQIVPSLLLPMIWKVAEGLSLTKKTKCILIPLVVEKKAIGILSIWGDKISKIDIQAASIFGGQIAIAIENANLLEEVKRLAVTDELTNILNRRGFEEVAQREFGAALRYTRPLSIIMIDIDRFKGVNDVYGHQVGDEILKEVAVRCQSKIRETDFLSRYGGEEFIILLSEQKAENAKFVAERIRKQIADQSFTTSIGKISITVSLGVTSLNEGTTSISTMIRNADKALYQSKGKGRNQVTYLE